MRNLCQLKDLNPTHTLAILNIRTGDLFLTRENMHGRPPVIGFLEYMEGVTKVKTQQGSRTSYFMPIEAGTVGIYYRKNVNQTPARSNYWAKFHEVFIEGKRCVIHEQFIEPLRRGVSDGSKGW